MPLVKKKKGSKSVPCTIDLLDSEDESPMLPFNCKAMHPQTRKNTMKVTSLHSSDESDSLPLVKKKKGSKSVPCTIDLLDSEDESPMLPFNYKAMQPQTRKNTMKVYSSDESDSAVHSSIKVTKAACDNESIVHRTNAKNMKVTSLSSSNESEDSEVHSRIKVIKAAIDNLTKAKKMRATSLSSSDESEDIVNSKVRRNHGRNHTRIEEMSALSNDESDDKTVEDETSVNYKPRRNDFFKASLMKSYSVYSDNDTDNEKFEEKKANNITLCRDCLLKRKYRNNTLLLSDESDNDNF